MQPPEPQRVQPHQFDTAGEMLARAFHDDPPTVWLFPDEAKRRRVLRWNARLMCRYGHRYGELHSTSADTEGVAIWLPPERPFASLARLIRVGGLVGPLVTGLGEFRRFLAWSGAMEKLHKRDVPPRHWYLMVLGVDPERQGRGLGGKVIQPVLARADSQRLPCYLETAKEINLSFYRKHGFEVVAQFDLPGGGPPIWTMKREPIG
jgi:ribosomal protein S18 acetylase RimI-like enzyme